MLRLAGRASPGGPGPSPLKPCRRAGSTLLKRRCCSTAVCLHGGARTRRVFGYARHWLVATGTLPLNTNKNHRTRTAALQNLTDIPQSPLPRPASEGEAVGRPRGLSVSLSPPLPCPRPQSSTGYSTILPVEAIGRAPGGGIGQQNPSRRRPRLLGNPQLYMKQGRLRIKATLKAAPTSGHAQPRRRKPACRVSGRLHAG